MKGELYKEEEGYYVFVNTVILGTTRPLLNLDLVKYKLSIANCEEIEQTVHKNDLGHWDIWVVMSCRLPNGCTEPEKDCSCDIIPALDENSCLILKKNVIC
jgi:hypothetical protein